MTRYWVTTGSTHPEAVVNPLAAACAVRGYIPDRIHLLMNAGLAGRQKRLVELLSTTVEAYGDASPTIDITELEVETNFTGVAHHYQSAIQAAREVDGAVAIDVTPGRKFMSVIAFQVAIQDEADHIFYLYVNSGELFGRVYPDIPRTGTTLYDFIEVLG